ncbi:MAG: dephospho-CoA kinase [Giesbergeria sp.]|nr:dephospho-CoA kinase [Giesbergeria sp.]MBP7084683.1 dephospho-CoA kinase [Giesbergeria sp.]
MSSHAALARRLGLTGGIGSGKSTVGAFLAAGGGVLIDADALSRASTASHGEATSAIANHFGPEFLDAQGALDRVRMRNLVFSDLTARARLEAIVHPIVLRGIAERAAAAELAGAQLVVLDIPLLVESGRWAREVDAIIVVDCLEETQIERVMQRSAMTREQVQSVINAQASRPQRRAVADAVIFNDGLSLSELAAKTRTLAQGFAL